MTVNGSESRFTRVFFGICGSYMSRPSAEY